MDRGISMTCFWSKRLKQILEVNTPYSCGMQVSKPICDYMGRIAEHIVEGGKKPPNPEAGTIRLYIFCLDIVYDFVHILYIFCT